MEIKGLKEEMLTAKRILKDPNLSHFATRKFKENIDKVAPNKFLQEECEIRDLIEVEDGNTEEKFEIELNQPHNPKLFNHIHMQHNSELGASALTQKNQFKKLNYTQFNPNTITVRK